MKRSCWGFCHRTGEPKELWPDFLLICVTDLSFIQNIVIAFLKVDANVFQFPKTVKFVKMSIKSFSLCIFQTGLNIILVKDLSAIDT